MNKLALTAAGAALFAAGLSLGAVVDLGEPAHADEAESPGYLVVLGRNYDREALRPYGSKLPPVYEQYGGTYLAVSTEWDTLEGDYPYQSIVISKWPSRAAASEFWNSPEYAEVRKLREGIGEFTVIAVDGMPTGATAAPLATGN